MTNTPPHAVSGFDSDPSEWLTVSKAARSTAHLLPIEKPLHRSAIHRWVSDGKVEGRFLAGRLYVSRSSLEAPLLASERKHPPLA